MPLAHRAAARRILDRLVTEVPLYRIIPTGVLIAAACVAHAGPMGFRDSWMTMADLGPNWREIWSNHAFTPRDAVGAGVLAMRSDDRQRTRNLTEATYTRLLARWNAPDAQTNLWLVAGIGAVDGNDFTGRRTLYAPGVQLDYETTRVYTMLFSRLYRAPRVRHDYNAVRAGFSFFEAEYDEVQPWLVVEARHMRGLPERVEWTPMLRLISKNFFVEAGFNNARQGRLNFMYIF
jgi:hypothetical protein